MKVSSPDPLADDPDRWRRLFAQFGHVSYVTVARGNGNLLRALAERREAGRKLEGSTANVNEVTILLKKNRKECSYGNIDYKRFDSRLSFHFSEIIYAEL